MSPSPPLHEITIGGFPPFSCGRDERVLIAMEKGGRSLVPVGCRGGGCGLCRVQVLDGDYVTGPMSKRHVSEADRSAGYALACRLYPRSNLRLAAAPSPHCVRALGPPNGPEGLPVPNNQTSEGEQSWR